MGVQYKSFDPDYTQVYGMYQKDNSVPIQEEIESPMKTTEEPEESKGGIIESMNKDPVGVYVPPVSLLAPRGRLSSFHQKGSNMNNVVN